jgi:hypothetical protein
MRPHKHDLRSEVSRDVISLETGRRVSAALHMGSEGVELFLLNGGSEVEYLHVDVLVPGIREPLCCGSFGIEAGRHHILDLERPTRSAPLRVRILGGSEPIVLEQPDRRLVTRSSLALCAVAAALVIGLAPQLPAPRPVSVARAPVVSPLQPRVHGHSVIKPGVVRPSPVAHVVAKLPPVRPATPSEAASVRVAAAPRMDSLRAPSVITGTQQIPVTFRGTGQQVRIVAKIGPRTLETRIIGASRGKIILASPPPSPLTRILTVEAWAQSNGRSASRVAMVVLLPPNP